MRAQVRKIATDIPDDPPSLDPQRATDMCSTRILNNVLEGLVRIDPTGTPVPGAASAWSVAGGGTEYTFLLQRSCWSDGSPVTAHDFEHAWRRVLQPEVESPYATLMRGVAAEAAGDDVLRVRLDSHAPRFLRLTSFSTFLPVKRGLPEALGARFARTERDTVFNGPYRISRWERGLGLVMTRNPAYHAHDDVQVDEVRWRIVKEADALIELYRRRELDVVYRVPTRYLREGFDLAGDLQVGPDCLTEYLVFNTRSPLLRSAGVRRALGRPVPRTLLLGDAVRFGFRPAYGLVPPGITDSVRSINGDCFGEDAGEAERRLAGEAWPPGGEGAPPALVMVGENTTQGIEHMRLIAASWTQRLGVRVTLVPLPLGERIQRVQRGDFDVAMVHWRADYDDSLSFLELFRSRSPWNEAGWENAAYDRLIDRAEALEEPERSACLAAAERLLLDEMPIAPLYFQVRPSLVRPGITGIASVGVGADQSFRWARLDLDPPPRPSPSRGEGAV
jgi:oligopeptide transport system substrate-binding protein